MVPVPCYSYPPFYGIVSPHSGYPNPVRMSLTDHRREPVWRPRSLLRRGRVPARDWRCLVDPASLTQRVVTACAGRFRVHVIDQHWMRPLRNEARALGVPMTQYALVRQVFLMCDDEPWVYARTVIPASTLTGRLRQLSKLRSRSLGAFLFADPTMSREELHIVQLTARDKLFRRATVRLKHKPEAVWGRRSVFRLSDKPLLVSEIFLPAAGVCRD